MMEQHLKNRMCLEHEFSGCRLVDGFYDFFNWQLKVNIAALKGEDGEDEEDHHKNMTVAFQKINFFLQSIIDQLFVISIKDYDVMDVMFGMDTNNTVILLPDAATDDIFVQALHAKLCTLTSGVLYIGEISLRNSMNKSTFTFNCFDGEYDLPLQLEFGGENSLHEDPWWNRYDCDTYDLRVPTEHLNERESLRESMSSAKTLLDLEHSVLEDLLGNHDKQPKVVKITELWKPKEA